ncbi:hypothetical protein QUC31_017428 [Theobroma cacao]
MEELKKVSFVAAPFMAVAVSQYLLHVVSMMMAGQLAELSLSGVAIATSFCNVTGFRMENTGAALALGLSYWFNVILRGFYMKYLSSCEKTRVLILKDIFLSVKEFFHFGIPSAVMVCLEWWAFEILVLLSELLPNSKLETSVLSIWYYYTHPYKHVLHFNIPVGIRAAASTRVSNELGAGNPQAAQIAALVVMVLTLAESFIASTILFCCRHAFGYAYSNDKEVVNNVTKMIPLMCLSIVMDSLHAVLRVQTECIIQYLETILATNLRNTKSEKNGRGIAAKARMEDMGDDDLGNLCGRA